MTGTRRLTLAFALGRVAFGTALLGPPGWVAERWLGPTAGQPAARVATRGLAAREIAVSLGAIDAVRRSQSPTPWLAALLTGDLADTAATLAVGDALPARARWGTVALAGGTALAGAVLIAAEER